MNRHLLILGLALGACADPEERSTTWEYLHATIIEPSCATANCHSHVTQQGTPGNPIDLSTPERAYLSLTFAHCGDDPFGNADSYVVSVPQDPVPPLIQLLRGEFSGNYPQMPVDVPLPEGEIDVIQQWITEGARCP